MSLLDCSLRWTIISLQDAGMSTPELGRTLISLDQFAEVMLTVICGLDQKMPCGECSIALSEMPRVY